MSERQATLEGERQAGLEEAAAPEQCANCPVDETNSTIEERLGVPLCPSCADAWDRGNIDHSEVKDVAE